MAAKSDRTRRKLKASRQSGRGTAGRLHARMKRSGGIDEDSWRRSWRTKSHKNLVTGTNRADKTRLVGALARTKEKRDQRTGARMDRELRNPSGEQENGRFVRRAPKSKSGQA
jgi:hypothetical protein